MDWNNDGQIGMDDLILTEIILEDDEDEQKIREEINQMVVAYQHYY